MTLADAERKQELLACKSNSIKLYDCGRKERAFGDIRTCVRMCLCGDVLLGNSYDFGQNVWPKLYLITSTTHTHTTHVAKAVHALHITNALVPYERHVGLMLLHVLIRY